MRIGTDYYVHFDISSPHNSLVQIMCENGIVGIVLMFLSGTLNLLELCKEYNIPKFILGSTSSLYVGQKMPFKEELPVNTPISPYASSKKAAEAMLIRIIIFTESMIFFHYGVQEVYFH